MENFIEIDGKKYAVKFTYSALMELEKETKKTFSEVAAELGKGSMSLIVLIAYIGMKTAARINKEKFKMKIEEVGDILTPDSILEITNLFGESFAPSENKDETTDEQKKTG